MNKNQDIAHLCAELTLKNINHPPGLVPNAVQWQADRFKKLLDKQSFFDILIENQEAKAYVLAWHEEKPWHGVPHTQMSVQASEYTKTTVSFVNNCLNQLHFDEKTQVSTSFKNQNFYKLLLDFGLGIDALVLLGDVTIANSILPPQNFGSLVVEKMKPLFIDETLQVIKISLKPEFGWGSAGSFEIILAPEIQGLGLARSIYKFLLERLAEKNVRVFSGGTSQKPVIKLGKQMGRWLKSVEFRKNAPFDEEYFRDYLG